MTIAIGILASDGVVIAADTQESYGPGFAKAQGYKIFSRVVEDEARSVSISGAGSSGYLDAAFQDLSQAFIESPDPCLAEKRMHAAFAAFYQDHVIKDDVDPDFRPRVVLGLHWKNGPSVLMSSEGSALHRQKRPAAVGVGGHRALSILENALPEHKKDLPTDVAAVIAAYTVYRVKQSTEGCGLGTHVTVLADGHSKHFSRDAIRALEDVFGELEALETGLLAYVLGRPINDADKVRGNLADWFGQLRHRIATLQASTPPAEAIRLKFDDERPGPTERGGYIRVFGDALVTRQAVQSVPPRSKRGRKSRPPSPG